MECMAASDNVLRAGFTRRHKDVENFVDHVKFSTVFDDQTNIVEPRSFSQSLRTMVYDPPAKEFAILQTRLSPGETEVNRAIDGPSIAVVIEGNADVHWEIPGSGIERLSLSIGDVVFIGAGTEVTYVGARSVFILYRATAGSV